MGVGNYEHSGVFADIPAGPPITAYLDQIYERIDANGPTDPVERTFRALSIAHTDYLVQINTHGAHTVTQMLVSEYKRAYFRYLGLASEAAVSPEGPQGMWLENVLTNYMDLPEEAR